MRTSWVLLFIACKSPATATLSAPERLVVHFGSICCGTDQAAEVRLDSVTDQRVKRTRAHWGKEGERDECFDLSALDPLARESFVKRVRAAVAGGENVTIDEGECHDER